MSAPAGGQHELVLVDSTADLAPAVIPRVGAALAAEEPVYLELEEPLARAVLDAVGESPLLHVLPRVAPPARAPRRMDEACRIAAPQAETGRRIRLVSQAPAPLPARWEEWLRLEAAIGVLLPQVWQVCIFQRDALTGTQLAELSASHALLDTDGAARANPDLVEPTSLLRRSFERPLPTDRLGPPVLRLGNPSPRQVRTALQGLLERTELSSEDAEALAFAANEVTVNALRHGRCPVTVEAWAGRCHAAVAVTDAGAGPADPLVGLVLDGSEQPGRGLWVLHRLVDVQHCVTEDGYTALVSMGDLTA